MNYSQKKFLDIESMKLENLDKLNKLQEIRRQLKLVVDSNIIKSIKVDVYCSGQWTANLPIEFAEPIKTLCENKLKEIEKEMEKL